MAYSYLTLDDVLWMHEEQLHLYGGATAAQLAFVMKVSFHRGYCDHRRATMPI